MSAVQNVIHLKDLSNNQIARFKNWFEALPTDQKKEIREIVRADGRHQYRADAISILEFLNRKRADINPQARGFRPVPSQLKFIEARLAEGADTADCKGVIAAQCRKCRDGDFGFRYLRPETLFNATKFESYLADIGS